jgi:hypothetical protein
MAVGGKHTPVLSCKRSKAALSMLSLHPCHRLLTYRFTFYHVSSPFVPAQIHRRLPSQILPVYFRSSHSPCTSCRGLSHTLRSSRGVRILHSSWLRSVRIFQCLLLVCNLKTLFRGSHWRAQWLGMKGKFLAALTAHCTRSTFHRLTLGYDLLPLLGRKLDNLSADLLEVSGLVVVTDILRVAGDRVH